MMEMTSPREPRHVVGPIYEWQFAAEERTNRLVQTAVEATGPNSRRISVAAFRDGDTWRARLATYQPGEWRWSSTGSLAEQFAVAERSSESWPSGPLRLSEDRRYLTFGDGAPFFFLADTAWSIVWKGTPDQWARYLDQRARLGFSVLQVNLLPWRWEMTDVEGNRPFLEGDPDRPNPAYFRRYDQFCAMAAERGLFVCLMLIWGGPRPLLPAVYFSPEQAVEFARYAVARFSAYPMLWSLSGDAPYVEELAKWDAVGAAVDASDPYAHPTTNHLTPQMNWYGLHHDAPWHDFHMLQTGHRRSALADVADLPAHYYHRQPVKAVVNGEPWYEAHPSRDTVEYGPVFTPAEVRYAFWVSVLSGATMGHTYGSQGIWNWKRPGDNEEQLAGPQIGPLWFDAMEHPGARQCGLGAKLLRTLPWWRLQPASERVQLDPSPGELSQRPFCAIAPDSTWVVYLPRATGQVVLKGIEPAAWRAAWFDPRTGGVQEVGAVEPTADHKWRAPASPSPDDWILVLKHQRGE